MNAVPEEGADTLVATSHPPITTAFFNWLEKVSHVTNILLIQQYCCGKVCTVKVGFS